MALLAKVERGLISCSNWISLTTGNILAKASLLQGPDTQKARAFLSNVGGPGVHLTQGEANGFWLGSPRK